MMANYKHVPLAGSRSNEGISINRNIEIDTSMYGCLNFFQYHN